MTAFNIKLAGIPMRIEAFYESTKRFCRDYLTEEEPLFSLVVMQDDIADMRRKSRETDIAEGREPQEYSDSYLETLALYQEILDRLLPYNVLLFHGSVVAVGGKCYLFTAKSGTGKTTHTKLWLKNIPDCHVLNGDKPLMLFRDSRVYACGTPWQGKENYGTNEILPLDGICILERATVNQIEKIPFRDALQTLLMQSHRPTGSANLIVAMKLLQKLTAVKLYRLGCNMEDEAALVSYREMVNT